MSKLSKVISLFLFMIFMGVCAYAAWDSSDVNDIVKKIKAGESFNESGNFDGPQIVSFNVGGIIYSIDIKAKLCYGKSLGGQSADTIILVPCKAIKDGYPLFAPIITWEK